MPLADLPKHFILTHSSFKTLNLVRQAADTSYVHGPTEGFAYALPAGLEKEWDVTWLGHLISTCVKFVSRSISLVVFYYTLYVYLKRNWWVLEIDNASWSWYFKKWELGSSLLNYPTYTWRRTFFCTNTVTVPYLLMSYLLTFTVAFFGQNLKV